MVFIDYIKRVVEDCGFCFKVGNPYDLNAQFNDVDFDAQKEGVVFFCQLLSESDYNGRSNAVISLYCSQLCSFDYDAYEISMRQNTLRNKIVEVLAAIERGNVAHVGGVRYNYGVCEYAENFVYTCARFTLEGLAAEPFDCFQNLSLYQQ